MMRLEVKEQQGWLATIRRCNHHLTLGCFLSMTASRGKVLSEWSLGSVTGREQVAPEPKQQGTKYVHGFSTHLEKRPCLREPKAPEPSPTLKGQEGSRGHIHASSHSLSIYYKPEGVLGASRCISCGPRSEEPFIFQCMDEKLQLQGVRQPG